MRKRFGATLTLVTFAAILLAAHSAVSAQIRDKSEAVLKAAMDKELIEGDLKGAIEQYKKIAQSKDRHLAARALLHMAECYRKLGDAESRRIYERVIKEFADQTEAVTQARNRLSEGAKSGVMNARLVWVGPAVNDEGGTISPDGRYLSFSDWTKGEGDLAIHEFATGLERHITDYKRDGGNAEESAISRDGKWIAYTWAKTEQHDHHELRIANLTGEPNSRRLYGDADVAWLMAYCWSPDDKSIAVQVQHKNGSRQIGAIAVGDGSLRVLKSVDWQEPGLMSFSPDGRWLAYDLPEAAAGAQRRVFIMAVDGSREIPVEHRGHDRMVGWSPDGKWLLFSSDRSGSPDLWAVPFGNGGSLGSAQLLKSGFERSTPLGVTSSGTLYYAQEKGGGPSRIQIASLDTTGKLTSPVELSESYRDSNSNPKWSPDGKRLAYMSTRGPVGAKTYIPVIRSIETGQVRELRDLSPNLNSVTLDSWTPDGRSLLVKGQNLKGRWIFSLVDAETGETKPLSGFDNVYNSRAAWMPDGRSFLIDIRGSRPGLYRVDLGTGDASEIMPIPQGQGDEGLYPLPSVDGKSFYYLRIFKAPPEADSAIIKRNLSSGAEAELVRRPVRIGPPRGPTPGDQYITALSSDPATNSRVILLIPIAGGETRELMRVPSQVKPEDLDNYNVGQSIFPGAVAPTRPILIIKRTSDHESGPAMGGGKDPSELWLFSSDGRESQKIGNTPASFTEENVSADGRHFAFVVTDPGSRPTVEVWALENFLPKPVATH